MTPHKSAQAVIEMTTDGRYPQLERLEKYRGLLKGIRTTLRSMRGHLQGDEDMRVALIEEIDEALR